MCIRDRYSAESQKPYLSRQGIMNLRSSFARDIFKDDLREIYQRQTEHRDALRSGSREVIAEIVSRINSGTYDNSKLEEMLLQLADRLSKTSGKKPVSYTHLDVYKRQAWHCPRNYYHCHNACGCRYRSF